MSNDSTLSRFQTPAQQAVMDFGKDKAGLKMFQTSWNANVNRWTEQSIIGNPWSNEYDDDRYYYFNPLTTPIPAGNSPVPITWDPFPNRLYNFFQDPNAPPSEHLTQEQIYELADVGRLTINGQMIALDKMPIPVELCPTNNWKGALKGYDPYGPRGWLDEYCEWSITRDENGKLKSVTFTCENPDYWFTLWRQSPALVTQLYQQYVNPNVQEEDLYLLDQNYQPVVDATTGLPAYDPINKWNRGTKSTECYGGAMHLTSPPNTLSAEIYLAAAATIARQVGNNDAQTLICCAQYGRPRRNSDPHIGQTANQVAASGNKQITLTDPVGLYIQSPNFALWSVMGQPKYDVQQFWTVKRGHTDPQGRGSGYDSILQATFTVPDGLDPEDIIITNPNGGTSPLQWAGQIVETFKIALRVNAIDPPASTSQQPVPQAPRPCVVNKDENSPDLQPWAVQLLSYDMYLAQSTLALAPDIKQGTTVKMVLLVQGGMEKATIEFDPPTGIAPIKIDQYLPDTSGTPGQTSGGGTQGYVFDLTVDATAPAGDRALRVTNINKTTPPGGVTPIPGFLQVVSA